jgi:multidrug efflux system membrane fusion protein
MLNRPDDGSHTSHPADEAATPHSRLREQARAERPHRRRILWAAVVLVAGVLAATVGRNYSFFGGGGQKGAPPPRVVSVEVATAVRKAVPVEVDSIGTVTPIAFAALKSRLETIVAAVHFEDGARVKQNDLLFSLDSRQVDAQIAQAQGALAKDKAQLEGAERDLRRFSELVTKGATPQINVDNTRTQVEMLRGAVTADKAALENLQVQKSYTEIRAPIAGRASVAQVKIGNLVRPADAAALTTINQMSPIYVTFAIPQRLLGDLREATAAGEARVTATLGGGRMEAGTVAMIENNVDQATGMISIRAVMENAQENLWPGTLVNTTLTLRNETVVVVPTVAVQRSQAGEFVFVIKDGVARLQPVKVARTHRGVSVIAEGVSDGETVVVDGQMLLSNGTRVQPRERKAGA